MPNYAIEVKNLSKQYRIFTSARPKYRTLRDEIAHGVQKLLRRENQNGPVRLPGQAAGSPDKSHRQDEYFWALKDVSINVGYGDVVGVIGANGAGKSTLLKVLTGITEPTIGTVDLYGRVGSLLEVGTGFHKELTGRENVYLNGAILGMKKTEIDRKFDEIVAFSEFEKFIDTPVKFYSSGMQVRLAFSVAAHLEPEILLVDEVLAVGDALFQRKSLNKMEEVGQQGRTVVFVSHHMPSITRLCERVIWLNKGKVEKDGPSQEVVGDYLRLALDTHPDRVWTDQNRAPGNEIVRLRAVRIKTEDGKVSNAIDVRSPIILEMEYEVLTPGYVLYPYFTAQNNEGLRLFSSFDTDPKWRRCPRPAGHYVSRAIVPGNFFNEGTVIIGPAMRTHEPSRLHFFEREAIGFEIIESSDGDSARVDEVGRISGAVRPLLDWETDFSPHKNWS